MAQDWVSSFLASLATSPNVSEACRQAGISRQSAYLLRRADPDFAALWDDALESATDDLVGEAYRRAKEGTEKPLFYKGEEIARVREYSDTLAIFLLKAHRPERYRDTARPPAAGDDNFLFDTDLTPDDPPQQADRPAT